MRTPDQGPLYHYEPMLAPVPPGTRCAVCSVRAATHQQKLGLSWRQWLMSPVCADCTDSMPALLSRLGFAGLRRLIERNMSPDPV
jgi:hypothetical protein